MDFTWKELQTVLIVVAVVVAVLWMQRTTRKAAQNAHLSSPPPPPDDEPRSRAPGKDGDHTGARKPSAPAEAPRLFETARATAEALPPGDGPREGGIRLDRGAEGDASPDAPRSLVAHFIARAEVNRPDGIATQRVAVVPPLATFTLVTGAGPMPGVAAAFAGDGVRDGIAAAHRSDGADLLPPSAETLVRVLQTANEKLHAFIATRPELEGSIASAVAVAFTADTAIIAHVGAERVYRGRDGQAEPLTRDHSLVNDFIRMKNITDEAEQRDLRRNAPHRHVIVRALGPKESVDVEVTEHPLRAGDRFLLVTKSVGDTLEDASIPDDEMRKLLDAGAPLEPLCARLLAKAAHLDPLQNHAAIVIAIENGG
ncbi:PP2C family protein-serine/threonine phosphatase [Chondromyces apiculatus]|uniref:PPM-type phosphatase domain-containing protein n=1 Tax=Chondromyces apiculatus DSM 436 TaxID=1192034 RepID=A0A017TE67_9BACT|nr:hypothetical protein [Chondromyces apiculatus]EYF07105.1 Hypothetical protein CAP_0584 [Chondromyces apiculatus DSM 436]